MKTFIISLFVIVATMIIKTKAQVKNVCAGASRVRRWIWLQKAIHSSKACG
jgi:hypothetical protein